MQGTGQPIRSSRAIINGTLECVVNKVYIAIKVSGIFLWEVQNAQFKMAAPSATFPSLLPRLTNDLWFTLEKRLDDDAALIKEEEEYAALVRLTVYLSCWLFVDIFK